MRLELSPAERRTGGRLLVLAGLGHLLLPDLVLDCARAACGKTLDVVLIPRDDATRRVRLLGAAMLVVGLAARRGERDGSHRRL